MTIIKKILVPVDFSQQSANALSVAAGIARQCDAQITLLHVVDVPYVAAKPSYNILGQFTPEYTPETETEGVYMTELLRATAHQLAQMRAPYPDVNIHEKVAVDRVAKHIADFVGEGLADLIVMGTRGSTDDQGVFMGSNTEKVIRLAKCPVLSVRQANHDLNFRNICLASDFREVPGQLIDQLKFFQRLFGATIHLLKVITPANFELSPVTLQSMRSFAEIHELEDYTVNFFNYYTEYEGIIAFANEQKADMIALATYGNTGLVHLLMGSVAEDVANHSNIPVLTCSQYAD